MSEDGAPKSASARLGMAGWIAIAIMAGLLAWAGWYAIHAWNALAGVDISATGWFFIVIGILLTLGLGGGLMALVFYSSRKDFDR
jgi:hypothetical protein